MLTGTIQATTMNDAAEGLRLAPEADVVVQIQQVKKRPDVLAFGTVFIVRCVDVFPRFRICRHALFHPSRPLHDFQFAAIEFRIGRDPRQNFPVTLAGGELFFQGGGIDADEIQEPLIQRTIVDVFPIFPDDGRAALVQHAR